MIVINHLSHGNEHKTISGYTKSNNQNVFSYISLLKKTISLAIVKKYLGLISIILILYSCLPEGNDTYVVQLIPEKFKTSWSLAMKCKSQTYDVAQIAFQIDDPKIFAAEGYGIDYDTSGLHIFFHGFYDMNTDSLFCTITTLETDSNFVSRIDSFNFLFEAYQGEYINTINTYMAPGRSGCPAAVRFLFDADSTQTTSSIMFPEFGKSLFCK